MARPIQGSIASMGVNMQRKRSLNCVVVGTLLFFSIAWSLAMAGEKEWDQLVSQATEQLRQGNIGAAASYASLNFHGREIA